MSNKKIDQITFPIITISAEIRKRKPIEQIRANDPERDRRLVQRTAVDGKGRLITADIMCHDQAEHLDWIYLQSEYYFNHSRHAKNGINLQWHTEIIKDPNILNTAQCNCGLCVEERTGKRQ